MVKVCVASSVTAPVAMDGDVSRHDPLVGLPLIARVAFSGKFAGAEAHTLATRDEIVEAGFVSPGAAARVVIEEDGGERALERRSGAGAATSAVDETGGDESLAREAARTLGIAFVGDAGGRRLVGSGRGGIVTVVFPLIFSPGDQ